MSARNPGRHPGLPPVPIGTESSLRFLLERMTEAIRSGGGTGRGTARAAAPSGAVSLPGTKGDKGDPGKSAAGPVDPLFRSILPPADCWLRYNRRGLITLDGGYLFVGESGVVVEQADDLQWIFKRFAAGEELLVPEADFALPVDWTTDPNNVPGVGTTHRTLAYRGADRMYHYDGTDVVGLIDMPDLPAGRRFVVLICYLASSVPVRTPTGGSFVADTSAFTAPDSWTQAFPVPTPGQFVSAATILFAIADGETWEQIDGKGSWSRVLLSGSVESFASDAHIVRIGNVDADGVDREEKLRQLVPGSTLIYYVDLVRGFSQWIQWPVLGSLPIGDPSRGRWVTLGPPSAYHYPKGRNFIDVDLTETDVLFGLLTVSALEVFANLDPYLLSGFIPDPSGEADGRILKVDTGAFAFADNYTDLRINNRNADTFDVTSSTGIDATLPSATNLLAGLVSAADKSKLDGLSISGMAVTNPIADVVKNPPNASIGSVAIPDSWKIGAFGSTFFTIIFYPDGRLRLILSGIGHVIRREVLDRLKITVTQAGETYETVGVFHYGDSPWDWTPANSAEVTAFYQHLDGSQTAELTLQVVSIAELIESVVHG